MGNFLPGSAVKSTLATELADLEERIWSTPSAGITSVQAVYVPAAAVYTLSHLSASIVLFRASAESVASENASRLASMQVAERNIEDRLRPLTGETRQLRQESNTSELPDTVTAFEALNERAKSPAGAR